MSKNVLVISVSPRKGGNSDILCDEFIRGVQESGSHTGKIFLVSKNIKYYMGCGICNTTQKCVQKDDMTKILDKTVKANVTVLATPVHFYIMDAQVETLIGRAVPGYIKIQNRDFYLIVAATDTERKMMEHTIEGFRGFTQDCLTGAKEKGVVYGTGAWQAGKIRGAPAVKQVYEMERNAQLKNKMHDGPEGVSYISCVLQL